MRPSFIARCLIRIIGWYQRFISPLLGSHCRFVPSCSHYAQDAIRHHGPWKALTLIMRRVLRCHPFTTSTCGYQYDPLPPRQKTKARQ
ncbi:MAG: membrane protein insertion efficiency factor YidD [Alphaproteobacteria bacterium GM7ARS4]|nr:membrane protein insertion efficiency factor YidD [Alphaproteobacteria bacterium GM7ARS4]